MTIDIESVLDTLKDGRTPKTQRSLEGLNTVLKDYFDSGRRDFSITTIGRISEEKGESDTNRYVLPRICITVT